MTSVIFMYLLITIQLQIILIIIYELSVVGVVSQTRVSRTVTGGTDFERQIFFCETFSWQIYLLRNLLRGNRLRNIFFFIFRFDVWPGIRTQALRLKAYQTTSVYVTDIAQVNEIIETIQRKPNICLLKIIFLYVNGNPFNFAILFPEYLCTISSPRQYRVCHLMFFFNQLMSDLTDNQFYPPAERIWLRIRLNNAGIDRLTEDADFGKKKKSSFQMKLILILAGM